MSKATTTQSLQDLLEEKRANFIVFLEGMFLGRDEDNAGAGKAREIRQHLAIMSKMGIADFSCYIETYIAPHRGDDFDGFISGLCVTFGQEIGDFDPADIAKCRRYLGFFCDCVTT